MAKISLGGNPINTIGELPKVGESAKNFTLVAADLSEKSYRILMVKEWFSTYSQA